MHVAGMIVGLLAARRCLPLLAPTSEVVNFVCLMSYKCFPQDMQATCKKPYKTLATWKPSCPEMWMDDD